MVQNKSDQAPRRRGRPRAYDPQDALERATDAFWATGYAGTSLDEISAATGMNRPSLYAAFGDKHALYLEALARYWRVSLEANREALGSDRPLKEALMLAYDAALDIYFSGDGGPRGCFVVGTAVTETVEDSAIRDSVAAGLRSMDADFETRLRTAKERGEIARDADPAGLAILASATMHTIAIRARAGIPRAELRDLVRKAVTAICGRPAGAG
jgi:AcrR family transcriptional regulator